MWTLTEDELSALGCSVEDIGTHSLRKGSSSYALGQVNGPTPVSVNLRMEQSLDNLKDRYIHFGEGADQLCGGMITGLPFSSEQFAVLPPHFPVAIVSKMNTEYWNDVVSGYSNYPRGVQSAFPFFLASVIHHEEYLREKLHPDHPIFKSRVFSANKLLQQQRGPTILAVGTSPDCGLKATGIPAHFAVSKQVNELREDIVDIRAEVSQIREDMATTLPNDTASKVINELRQNFVVNGVAPVSLHEFDTRFEALKTKLVLEFQQAISGLLMRPDTQNVSEGIDSGSQPAWKSWNWNDGQLCHSVPSNWQFPARASVKATWNLWHFGDKNSGIRPYRLLSKQHDIQPEHRMRHSRAQSVMLHMQHIIDETSLLPAGFYRISDLPLHSADKVFNDAFSSMMLQLYTARPKRTEEIPTALNTIDYVSTVVATIQCSAIDLSSRPCHPDLPQPLRSLLH